MDVRLCDLQQKEIVNQKDGSKLGFADDVLIDMTEKRVKALIVKGRLRWFGLLGRDPDVMIPWEKIEVIGEDAILVSAATVFPTGQFNFKPRRNRFLSGE